MRYRKPWSIKKKWAPKPRKSFPCAGCGKQCWVTRGPYGWEQYSVDGGNKHVCRGPALEGYEMRAMPPAWQWDPTSAMKAKLSREVQGPGWAG